MATTIKVRCNGPNKCVNEVDLEELIDDGEVTVYRVIMSLRQRPRRERYVLKCKKCSEGEVVVTRQMIEENLKRD